MVGEKIILTLEFTYDDLEEYEIEEAHFEHFKIKLLEDKEYQDKNGTWIAKQNYELTAQKSGTVTLPALKTHIEMIEPAYQKQYNKNKYLQKFDIYTNPLTLTVNPLPQGLQIAGEYQLHASVNTQQVNAGEPIHYSITLSGNGNIENLDFLTLRIPHVMIYEKSNNAAYEKTFNIVSDANFSIPPIVLNYYNQKNKEVELLRTNLFHITVLNPSSIAQKSHLVSILSYLLLAILFLLLLWYVYRLFQSIAYIDEKTYFIKQLKQTKNKEALLKKVASYMQKDRHLTRLIYTLENIEKSQFKALKKEIITKFYD
jgi:hypothetical protein